eukprot:GFUD01008171.1.p1 GENE.GFUD01008171.1~~GFUD01008171.1.p1  ORF type:complete len:353 (+),score=88.88 GFUD01008171.1:170-1228(+)
MDQLQVSLLLSTLLVSVSSQGLRCDTPADCAVDEYNPYCSKWGYCTWTPSFGDTGPPQSKGAVEDGVRGQCREDKDCTPWAPSCSPLGYCRGGVQDGSFGSRTNPKAGGEASDWIKANAKSGGGRNEEYYGKIEDDNRRTHVQFRKKYPKLFPKVSLDRLESIEDNVYSICTYCKYDPKSDKGSGSGSKSSGGRRGSQGKGSGKKNGGRNRPRSSGGRPAKKGSGAKSSNYESDIASGRIPGAAGKDYPNFSISGLNKKGFKGIKPAPQDKIPKNYPKNKGGNRGGAGASSSSRKGNRGGAAASASSRKKSGGGGGGGDCPGTLDDCMESCPANLRVFQVCVNSCARRCAKK